VYFAGGILNFVCVCRSRSFLFVALVLLFGELGYAPDRATENSYMDTYSKKMPAVQVHRLDTFSEKKSSDFGAKLRKTRTSFSRRPTPGSTFLIL
jgi:hypothetical protein